MIGKGERLGVYFFAGSLLLLTISCAVGKTNVSSKNFVKDTSFTVYSAYVKEVKKYPFIRIAETQLSESAIVKHDIKYKTISPGRSLLADVYYPKTRRKLYPAVLLIHGGGWKSGDKSQMSAMANVLANNGFVAVSAEYRLSPEAQYPAALNDLQDALRWMKKSSEKYLIDTSGIAVFGVSAGGQLAALLGSAKDEKSPVIINAVVDIDGILAFHHPESEEGTVASEWLGGTYVEKSTVWRDASALSHAGPETPPMLFINSQYPRFHAGRDDMITKLKPYGVYTEVHTLPNTPHTFWLFEPWFKPTMDYVISFLNRILTNEKQRT